MAEARIPVDLFNPGQVFACLGLVEAADILLGDAAGAFDWHNGSRPTFVLHAASNDDPVHAVLDFLQHASITVLLPPAFPEKDRNFVAKTDKKNPISLQEINEIFPSHGMKKDRLPAALKRGEKTIIIDYWTDGNRDYQLDDFKLWAGAGGYPGVALLKDALNLMQDLWDDAFKEPEKLFENENLAVPQSSSFRLDWRRDYIPLDTGFSLNEHGHITTVGYPLVEVLAAIGLTHARPQRLHDKLHYRYAALGLPQLPDDATTLHPPMFLRAALGCAELPFPMRAFRMHLDWPGKPGQARAITHVYEEATP